MTNEQASYVQPWIIQYAHLLDELPPDRRSNLVSAIGSAVHEGVEVDEEFVRDQVDLILGRIDVAQLIARTAD